MISLKLQRNLMKETTLQHQILETESFGKRLSRLRKACGLTQAELADKLGVSRRVIGYYETESKQIPGPILVNVAIVLGIPVEELLGHRQIDSNTTNHSLQLLEKLRQIEALPEREREAIILVIDSMLAQSKNKQEIKYQKTA